MSLRPACSSWEKFVLYSERRADSQMTERDECLAHALVGRIFDLLRECRAVLLRLEAPGAPESASAQRERLL